MLGQQFYNETIRKVVVAFGTMFNDIHLVRKDNNGTIIQTMKVPLAYGPRQKFLVRLREDADLTKQVAVTLPRLGFEITGLSYDPARKLNRVQKFKKVKSGNNKQLDTQYMPVPYNIDFELYVLSKQSDDALQIVEQILPYFQPDYTVTMIESTTMDTKRDIPFVLESVSYEDTYTGDFTSRRAIIYTLAFTAKVYLYGPISSSSIVRQVGVDLYENVASVDPSRKERITITPNPTSADYDDDYTFTSTLEHFDDGKNYDEETGDDK